MAENNIKLLHMNLLAQGLSVDGFMVGNSQVSSPPDNRADERESLNIVLNKAEFINGKFRVGGEHIVDVIKNGELTTLMDKAVVDELIDVGDATQKKFKILRYPQNMTELLTIQKLIYPCIRNGFGEDISISDNKWMNTYIKSLILNKTDNLPTDTFSLLNKKGKKYELLDITKKIEGEATDYNSEQKGWIALQKLVGTDEDGPWSEDLKYIVGDAKDDASIGKDGNRKQKILAMIEGEEPDVLVFVEDDFMETHQTQFIEEGQAAGKWKCINKGYNFEVKVANEAVAPNVVTDSPSFKERLGIRVPEIITVNKRQNWFTSGTNLYTCEIDERAANVTYTIDDMDTGKPHTFMKESIGPDTNLEESAKANDDNDPEDVKNANNSETNRLMDNETNIRHKFQAEMGGPYPSSIARHYKTNSNSVKMGGGKHHDGTTIYWNAVKFVCIKINLFNIDWSTKKKKSQGGVIVMLESRTTGDRFIVVGTHLSSDRKHEDARLEEWTYVKDAVNEFVSELYTLYTQEYSTDTSNPECKDTKRPSTDTATLKQFVNDNATCKNIIPIIYSMDANTHINFGNCGTQSPEQQDKSPVGGSEPLYKIIDKEYNHYWKELVPKNKFYSVNKMRGIGSDQPLKVNEHEVQLIDWVFGSNIQFKSPKETDIKTFDEAKSEADQSKKGYIIGPLKNDREDNNYDNYIEYTKSVEENVFPNQYCPSDHLPIVTEFAIDYVPSWREKINGSIGAGDEADVFPGLPPTARQQAVNAMPEGWVPPGEGFSGGSKEGEFGPLSAKDMLSKMEAYVTDLCEAKKITETVPFPPDENKTKEEHKEMFNATIDTLKILLDPPQVITDVKYFPKKQMFYGMILKSDFANDTSQLGEEGNLLSNFISFITEPKNILQSKTPTTTTKPTMTDFTAQYLHEMFEFNKTDNAFWKYIPTINKTKLVEGPGGDGSKKTNDVYKLMDNFIDLFLGEEEKKDLKTAPPPWDPTQTMQQIFADDERNPGKITEDELIYFMHGLGEAKKGKKMVAMFKNNKYVKNIVENVNKYMTERRISYDYWKSELTDTKTQDHYIKMIDHLRGEHTDLEAIARDGLDKEIAKQVVKSSARMAFEKKIKWIDASKAGKKYFGKFGGKEVKVKVFIEKDDDDTGEMKAMNCSPLITYKSLYKFGKHALPTALKSINDAIKADTEKEGVGEMGELRAKRNEHAIKRVQWNELLRRKSRDRSNIEICPHITELTQGYYKVGQGVRQILDPNTNKPLTINDLISNSQTVNISTDEKGTSKQEMTFEVKKDTNDEYKLITTLTIRKEDMNADDLGYMGTMNGGYRSKKLGFKSNGSQKKHKYFK